MKKKNQAHRLHRKAMSKKHPSSEWSRPKPKNWELVLKRISWWDNLIQKLIKVLGQNKKLKLGYSRRRLTLQLVKKGMKVKAARALIDQQNQRKRHAPRSSQV